MNELKATCIELVRTIENALSIGRFDRKVYVEVYGDDLVQFIEKQCEHMPNLRTDEFRIQASLNIAYRKGFDDCCELVLRLLALCDELPNEE